MHAIIITISMSRLFKLTTFRNYVLLTRFSQRQLIRSWFFSSWVRERGREKEEDRKMTAKKVQD